MSEPIHDTHFSNATTAIVKTVCAGIQSHPVDSPSYWTKQSPRAHLARAMIHIEKFLAGLTDERHLHHALTRMLMAVELAERERIAQEAKANA